MKKEAKKHGAWVLKRQITRRHQKIDTKGRQAILNDLTENGDVAHKKDGQTDLYQARRRCPMS